MQAASEMYAKLHNRATDAARAVEQHPKIQAAKKQLDLLLTRSLLSQLWEKGTLATAGSAEVIAARLVKPGVVSASQWTVGVAMELLNKLNTVPAYLASNVRWATAVPTSKVVHTLQTGWENIQPRVYGKNVPSADYKVQEEQTDDASVDSSSDTSANTADAVEPLAEQTTELGQTDREASTGETAQPIEGEDVEVCTEPVESSHVETAVRAEEPAGSSTVEEEARLSSETVPASGETRQTTEAQSSTQEKTEVSPAVTRPRSKTFYSLFRRPAAAQLSKEC